MDRVARRVPLARAPGALNGGHFRNCQHFCRSWRGDPLEKKNLKSLTMPKNWKGGPFEVFQHPFCRKTWKNLRKFFLILGNKSHNAEKNWKGGPFGIFQHPFCRKTSKKCRGDPLGKKFPKNVSQCRKKWKGGMVCYAEKQGKPFWSSSLGQMVQFDTIIFGRTFKNYFGQFVWIEKKVTIIVALNFMKRRLKKGKRSMHEIRSTDKNTEWNAMFYSV